MLIALSLESVFESIYSAIFYLRALATEGIQRGHMALHARNIALTVGAVGAEIDQLAKRMAEEKDVRADRALALLEELRKPA